MILKTVKNINLYPSLQLLFKKQFSLKTIFWRKIKIKNLRHTLFCLL